MNLFNNLNYINIIAQDDNSQFDPKFAVKGTIEIQVPALIKLEKNRTVIGA